jgi:hypothetical protein
VSPPLDPTCDFVLASGRCVWLLEPARTEIIWSDLLIHTTRICRYSGARHWTVLQHLALCVRLAEIYHPDDRVVAGYAGAHDLHEAVVGDMQPSMKRLLPDYKRCIETPWELHVHRSLRLAWPPDEELAAKVKDIDHVALAVEMEALKHPARPREWQWSGSPFPATSTPFGRFRFGQFNGNNAAGIVQRDNAAGIVQKAVVAAAKLLRARAPT